MYHNFILPLLACGILAQAADVRVQSARIVDPGPFPMMKRAPVNPVFALKLQAENRGTPGTLTFSITPANSVQEIILRTGNAGGTQFKDSEILAKTKPDTDGSVTITAKEAIPSGENWLWIHATPAEESPVGSIVEFKDLNLALGDQHYTADPIRQRIGYMVALPGEKVGQLTGRARECAAFRIPGLITTKKGTLVGCFDARYNNEVDLCNDIDVAVVRSLDGGQTWSTPDVALDAGPGATNGCGDPCILQDSKGRIWLQALAAHFGGGAVLGASKAGQGENVTGQWIMTTSSNEGKSWAKKHINPTRKIKQDEWTCILAGPGRGIVTQDDTIIFPAQIWWNKPPSGTPRSRSTICYSTDGGKNWNFGEGVPHGTSECQVAELSDGSIMITCRNEARDGKRVIYTTKNLGKTWEPHETNLNTLQDPVCQASLITAKHQDQGKLLLFSNPKSGGRNHMTIRASQDDGKTWSEGYEYDRRNSLGYSCLTQIDDHTIGVFYEIAHQLDGLRGIGFLKFPLDTILSEQTEAPTTTNAQKTGNPQEQAAPAAAKPGRKKK